jgi:cytochrome b6-f complex iron-sulfur subunit
MKSPLQHIDNEKKLNRRDFFRSSWKILGVVAAAELAIFGVSLLKPVKEDSKNKKGSTFKVAGNVDDFVVNSVTVDRVNKYFLVRESDGGFLALSLACSHLGCSVNWEAEKNQFICPCHSSAFDKHGNVLNSPAPRPLDYYPVVIKEGKVKVDLGQKIKRHKFEKNQMTYAL